MMIVSIVCAFVLPLFFASSQRVDVLPHLQAEGAVMLICCGRLTVFSSVRIWKLLHNSVEFEG